MKVFLRAPLLSLSGYGIHSRQVFEWLETIPDIDLTVEVLQWGMTCWMVNPEMEGGLIERIMSYSKEIKPGSYDYSFQVQLPDEWDTKFANKNIGITALVETDKCSEEWVDHCNKMDAVIVPSNFAKKVLEKSGKVKVPLHVVPEWINEYIMQPESLENTDINKARFATNFNFLLVGTITSRSLDDDRKNVLRAIKCFCESFENNKKVGLVVKASFGKGTKIDRRLTYDFLQSAIKTFRKGDYPKVTILHGNLTQLEIASLYKNKTIKCLISPTRGEGYGLPLLEAAASGLPIVATGWSGHTDFLSKGLYSDIDYNLKEIPESRVDGRIFIAGAKWAKINENDFKRKIKKIVYKYDNHEKKAHQLKLQVLDTLSKNAVLINYDDFFKKIC